jgi:hypothetical protein
MISDTTLTNLSNGLGVTAMLLIVAYRKPRKPVTGMDIRKMGVAKEWIGRAIVWRRDWDGMV